MAAPAPEPVVVKPCRADELAQRRGLTSELDEIRKQHLWNTFVFCI